MKAAFVAGTLPPEFNISLLSGTTLKPTVPETSKILDLEAYVKYLESKFLQRERTEKSWGTGQKHLLDTSPHLLDLWRENFHRTAYKYFALGAALSRSFQEPFYEKSKGLGVGHDFLSIIIYALKMVNSTDPEDRNIGNACISVAEVDYLTRKFPVYNFTPTCKWEECFGSLGEWLMNDKESRQSSTGSPASRPNKPIDGRSKNDKLREILQLLVMYGQMQDMAGGLIGFTEGEYPFWMSFSRRGLTFSSDDENEDEYDSQDGGSEDIDFNDDDVQGRNGEAAEVYDNGIGGGEVSEHVDDDKCNVIDSAAVKDIPQHNLLKPIELTAVLFGQFRPFSGTLTTDDDSLGTASMRWEVIPGRPVEAPPIPDLLSFAEILHCTSRRPNHINGRYPAPHPPLHFFTYLLQTYFRYQFDEAAFDADESPSAYEIFTHDGRIWADEGNWDGLLASAEVEQNLTYKEIFWGEYVEP